MITSRIRGVEEVILKVKKLENSLTLEELKPTIKEVAVDLQGDAYRDCPVDTGLLRGSITVKEIEKGYRVYVDDVYYDIFVHDGTRYMPPRPFLIGKNSEKAIRSLVLALKQHIKEVLDD